MSATSGSRLLLGSLVIVLSVGAVDSGIGREWDLFFIFLIGLAIAFVLVLRVEAHRPPIAIRRDLVHWLRDRASLTGESLDVVTDRAIETYRDDYAAGRLQGRTHG